MTSCQTLGYLCLYGGALLGILLFVHWAVSEKKEEAPWRWTDEPKWKSRTRRNNMTMIVNIVCGLTVVAAVAWAAAQPVCE